MKVLILSQNKNLYSTKRLLEETTKRGHQVDIVNPLKCYMNVANNDPMVFYRKRKLDDYDAIIPRISAGANIYGMTVIRQFEMMGKFCLNSSNSIGNARDKLKTLQLLVKEGLPLPKTGFANSTQQTNSLIKLVGGAPLVVKLLEGSQGRGVVLAETMSAANSVIDAFRELNANFLVQEFIKDAKGADYRLFVVGDKVVGSMKRQAKENEFRSNLHRGGEASVVKITPEERKIAIKAAKALNLNIAGIDMVRANDGPKILEVNSTPGLEGIERTTEKNIAEEIIKYLEKIC